MFPTPQSSDPHTAPPLPLGLALSQETQARLARVPLPNHNHFPSSGNQPQYLASANSSRHVVDRSNQLQPAQHLSTTSPTRWRTSPTRLDQTRPEVANQASSYQLTTSPTPSSSSPLNSQTSPSRRASDQGALWSSRRSQIEPDISPSRRTSAPHEHRGHLENHPQEINETHLAPFDSRLPVSNIFLCKRVISCLNDVLLRRGRHRSSSPQSLQPPSLARTQHSRWHRACRCFWFWVFVAVADNKVFVSCC